MIGRIVGENSLWGKESIVGENSLWGKESIGGQNSLWGKESIVGERQLWDRKYRWAKQFVDDWTYHWGKQFVGERTSHLWHSTPSDEFLLAVMLSRLLLTLFFPLLVSSQGSGLVGDIVRAVFALCTFAPVLQHSSTLDMLLFALSLAYAALLACSLLFAFLAHHSKLMFLTERLRLGKLSIWFIQSHTHVLFTVLAAPVMLNLMANIRCDYLSGRVVRLGVSPSPTDMCLDVGNIVTGLIGIAASLFVAAFSFLVSATSVSISHPPLACPRSSFLTLLVPPGCLFPLFWPRCHSLCLLRGCEFRFFAKSFSSGPQASLIMAHVCLFRSLMVSLTSPPLLYCPYVPLVFVGKSACGICFISLPLSLSLLLTHTLTHTHTSYW